MLVLRLAGRPLSLLPGTTLSLEISNPLFDEDDVLSGTFSYNFSLPLDDANRITFGYPEIIENVADLRRRFDDCEVEDEGFLIGTGGQLRIRKISPKRLEVAVGFALSGIAPELKERTLASFELGGLREVVPFVEGAPSPSGTPWQVPGLVGLANATVEAFEDYDFVFAPLRNHYSDLDPPVVSYLNPWGTVTPGLFGTPDGGSFQYPLNIVIPGGIPAPPAPSQFCPFIKLTYLLTAVFQELGVPVHELGLNEELRTLVLLSSGRVGNQFRLSDVLPALTLKEWLLRLRRTIGLVPDIGSDGVLRCVLRADVLAATDYEDWSHLAAPDYTERELSDVQGYELVYNVASGDTPAEAYFQGAVLDLPVGNPVDTAADLPTPVATNYLLLPAAELRIVVAEEAYYRSTQVFNFVSGQHTLSWAFYCTARPAVAVAGGGSQQMAQGITATALEVTGPAYPLGYSEDYLLPAFVEQPFESTVAGSERPDALRLAFYRGRQPARVAAGHPNPADAWYPMVTPFNRDIHGRQNGEYSLQLDGVHGTYAKLVGGWAELMATAVPVKRSFYLSAEHLAGLQKNRKKRIDGNLYLVKAVAVQLPIKKAATVTLIPLPSG